MGLLIGLRDARWPQTEPFTFAREFAMAWCGVSRKVARNGVAELETLGLIERTGRTGLALLWQLPQDGERLARDGSSPPPPRDGTPRGAGDGGPPDEEALIAAIIEAFDAEEIHEDPHDAARPSVAVAGPPPCPYEQHRASDWTADGGRRVCGRCRPPADPACATRGGAS